MNKARRAELDKILAVLEDIDLAGVLSDLEAIRDEEQESFDNMPEGLQQSDNGQRSEAAASALGDAASNLDDVISSLSAVVDSIREAQE